MHTLPLATGPGTPRLVDVCNIQYTAVLSISGLPDVFHRHATNTG